MARAKDKEYDLCFPNAKSYVNGLGWNTAKVRPNGDLRCEFDENGLYYVMTARPNGKVVRTRVTLMNEHGIMAGFYGACITLDLRHNPLRLTVESRAGGIIDDKTLDEIVGNIAPTGMVAKRAKRMQVEDGKAVVT